MIYYPFIRVRRFPNFSKVVIFSLIVCALPEQFWRETHRELDRGSWQSSHVHNLVVVLFKRTSWSRTSFSNVATSLVRGVLVSVIDGSWVLFPVGPPGFRTTFFLEKAFQRPPQAKLIRLLNASDECRAKCSVHKNYRFGEYAVWYKTIYIRRMCSRLCDSFSYSKKNLQK